MLELVVRYIHFLGIIVLASTLVAEHLLIERTMRQTAFKKLLILDAIYGISAIVTLGAGLSLWLLVGKPSSFYSSNFVFHIKLSMFIGIGLLSAFPTVYFLRQRHVNTDTIAIPAYIVHIILTEILLLLIMPMLGVLIARGIGNH